VKETLPGGLPAPLLLASRSPRRADLLRLAGIPFRVEPPSYDEGEESEGEPGGRALARAAGKADSVAGKSPRTVVLGADTVVVLDGIDLGKPRDADHARRMLHSLSGRTHEVMTALAVRAPGSRGLVLLESTRVTFRRLDAEEVEAYLETEEPYDKAGGYGIQGRAAGFVRGIRGCYFNVVGLPIAALRELLLRAGTERREAG
jgi:septum formation protein